MSQASETTVYQLKIVLLGISPMIWRRLLVRSDCTITELHYILQIAMGWSDDHLNRFKIHGIQYGVYHDGGVICGPWRFIALRQHYSLIQIMDRFFEIIKAENHEDHAEELYGPTET